MNFYFLALLCLTIGQAVSQNDSDEAGLNFSYNEDEYTVPELGHHSSRLLLSHGRSYHSRRRLQNASGPAPAPVNKPEQANAPEDKPVEVKPETPKAVEALPDIEAIIAENNKILKEIEEISRQIEEVTKKIDIKETGPSPASVPAPTPAPAEKKERRLQNEVDLKKAEPVAEKPAVAPHPVAVSPQPAPVSEQKPVISAPADSQIPAEEDASKKLTQEQLIAYIDQLIAKLPHTAPSS